MWFCFMNQSDLNYYGTNLLGYPFFEFENHSHCQSPVNYFSGNHKVCSNRYYKFLPNSDENVKIPVTHLAFLDSSMSLEPKNLCSSQVT